MLTSSEPSPASARLAPPAPDMTGIERPTLTRVLAITSNLEQASARLRVAALVGPLAARGVELVVRQCPRKGWTARREVLRSAGDYDAVLLHRKLLDPWHWRVLRGSAKRIVFDVDDAVMYPPGAGVYSRVRTRLRYDATARGVDHVVAGNAYLADLFRRRGCDVTVLPTTLDPWRYRLKRHNDNDNDNGGDGDVRAVGGDHGDRANDNGGDNGGDGDAGDGASSPAPRLVWVGSRSTLPYLRGATPALVAAARRVPGLRLLTIADRPLAGRRLPLPVEHVPWSLDTEAASLCRGDIGIAPLPADRWTLGKCGFKILQYMAAGLPVVASPVGANATLVRHGQTGLLAGSPDEWADAIAALAADAGLRRRMGRAGRRRVEASYRVDRAADVWAGLLRGPSRDPL